MITYIDKKMIENNTHYVLDRNVIFKKKIEKSIINKNKSYMIGDKISDTLAGKRYGITSYLVRTGEGRQEEESGLVKIGRDGAVTGDKEWE